MNDQEIVEKAYEKLDAFNDFRQMVDGKRIDVMPEDVRLTVWCDDGNETQGFVINKFKRDIGFELLIAKKWIEHERLIQILTQQEK